MYLAGEFGTDAKAISPYIASTFYAADRYATYVTQYKEYYENGGIILADRYTTANMVHQAGKIQDKAERKKIFMTGYGILSLIYTDFQFQQRCFS